MESNEKKKIIIPYDEYILLKQQAEQQIYELFEMSYDEIHEMKFNYGRLKDGFDEITSWHNESFSKYNSLRNKVVEFNSLPWYKRIFKNIVL